ncbi:DegT/DnrJ/EryC1/StrS family aminotransferase [Kordiimonas pumila]|uniref:DegT/DnrJ/EryC1/StrS family aminotransferase n=1 Tax=Kordiimonas pumila TaxID=2161677 RepID=A0ABV7D4R5_9PROT|nr:DegT/DnrJ/EryC1/StrS family aminotransferase [Kordiimonas pumila]
MTPDYKIFCLVPDLPDSTELEPFVAEMQANRWYTNFGPLTRRFEREMADFLLPNNAADIAVGTFSSATTALELVLKVMNLPQNARVLLPALTFPATALSVLNAGYTPVLSDVDAASWLLSPEIAKAALQDTSFDVVVPVATFGRPIDPKAWLSFQKETGIPVVLDAAAALGVQDVEPELITVFSLHATKPFGVGEGGLVVTADADLVKRAQSLSNFGFLGTAGVVQQIGTNAKFGEYYAAVGLAQLRRWQAVTEKRRQVAAWYSDMLPDGIQRQQGHDAFIPAVLCVFCDGKARHLTEKLASHAIQTRHWYLPLLHQHPALQCVDIVGGHAENLGVANHLQHGLFGLPFHGFLTKDDVAQICAILRDGIV